MGMDIIKTKKENMTVFGKIIKKMDKGNTLLKMEIYIWANLKWICSMVKEYYFIQMEIRQ